MDRSIDGSNAGIDGLLVLGGPSSISFFFHLKVGPRSTDRWIDGSIDGSFDLSIDVSIDRSIDRSMDGSIDRWVDRLMDGWIDGSNAGIDGLLVLVCSSLCFSFFASFLF